MPLRIFQLAAAVLVSLMLFWLIAELAQRASYWLFSHPDMFHSPALIISAAIYFSLMVAIAIRRRRQRQHRTPAGNRSHA